jgi:PsbP
MLLFLQSRPVYSSAWIVVKSSPDPSTGRFAYNLIKNSKLRLSSRHRLQQEGEEYSPGVCRCAASWCNDNNNDDDDAAIGRYTGTTTRRNLFIRLAWALVGSNLLQLSLPGIAAAQEENDSSSSLFTRQETDQFAYKFQPPTLFEQSGKPVKTHLDEVIFKSTSIAGYQIGITIDPVRINSLQQFGTAEEVAAKVVLAEVNRDGVLDVTLMQDAYASPASSNELSSSSFYQLNYQSKGTRGTKRFVTKFYVYQQKLYALTAQCKEEDYASVEKELLQAVDSFRLLV